MRIYLLPLLCRTCFSSIALLAGAAHAQYYATTTTVAANPASIVYGQTTIVTATVAVTGGSTAGLSGLPIKFSSSAGNRIATLGADGTASVSFSPIPVGSSPGNIGAEFEGSSSQGQGYSPSVGSVTVNILPGTATLQGPYTFAFTGTLPPNGTPVGNAAFALGTLVADGNGKITGEMDGNSKLGPFSGPVHGTYSLRDFATEGTMTLETAIGVEHFDLFISVMAGARTAALVPTDANTFLGAATLTAQPAAAIAYYAYLGNYTFSGLGETACTDCASEHHPAGLVTLAGLRSLSQFNFAEGTYDQTTGTAVIGISDGGTYSSPDAMGRFTLQLSYDGNIYPDEPTNYVGYIVDSAHIQLLSTDSHATKILSLETLSR